VLFNGVFMQSPITVDDRRGKWNVKTEYWLMQDDTCHLPPPLTPPHIQGLTATWMLHYVVVEIQMQIRLKISFPVLNIIRHTRILTVSEAHNWVRHMRYCFNANTSSYHKAVDRIQNGVRSSPQCLGWNYVMKSFRSCAVHHTLQEPPPCIPESACSTHRNARTRMFLPETHKREICLHKK